MSKPGPTQDPHIIAQVLVDAAVLGDAIAAQQHCLSERTIQRYRAKYAEDPTVSGLVAEQKKKLTADWIDRTATARNRILTKVLTLVDGSDNLREVVGALKIVHDANVSEKVIRDGLGEPGTGTAGPSTTAADFVSSAEKLTH